MSRVCAVVVTHHPKLDVLSNLDAVRPQVAGLVVVDNGSSKEALAWLRNAAEQLDFKLIANEENLGIAAALNVGCRWALGNAFEFVILFDQDSIAEAGFVSALVETYQGHPRRDRVGLVTSQHRDRNLGRLWDVTLLEDGGPITAITSGSLLPRRVFDQCGWFEEDLIIDWVDFEYCLRLRRVGFLIALCDSAVLVVNIGAAEEHRLFGRLIFATHHNARRRYYMARNRLVLTARWWREYPVWSIYSLRDFLLETLSVILFERERSKKLANTARGVRDALLGRMGKIVEL